MSKAYNKRSPAVRRIYAEVRELREATDQYYACPMEDNIFNWHFTIAGPSGTAFEGGRYHGRIVLPPEYPMKPPSIYMLTPNGRFEVGRKICLSVSDYHPETWRPSWSIRTVLIALIGFMPTPGNGAIAALDYTDEERRKLARRSIGWKCAECGACMGDILCTTASAPAPSAEDRQFMAQLEFKGSKSRTASECATTTTTPAKEEATAATAATVLSDIVSKKSEEGKENEAIDGDMGEEANSAPVAIAPAAASLSTLSSPVPTSEGAAAAAPPPPSLPQASSPQHAHLTSLKTVGGKASTRRPVSTTTTLAPPPPPPPPSSTASDWTLNLIVGTLVSGIAALVVRKIQQSSEDGGGAF